MALGAFRTTPINNLLFESKSFSIPKYKEYITSKLFRNIFFKDNSPLSKTTISIIKSVRLKNIPSTLNNIISSCQKFDIPINNGKGKCDYFPPWYIDNNWLNTSLSNYKKNETPTEVYRSKLLEIQHTLQNFTFIYTDGSKSEERVAYSVIMQNTILKCSILPEYTSVFTAEIIAIYEAINHVYNRRGNFAIFTDSLSAISSISNVNNEDYYASKIRQMIIKKNGKIQLIWIPGHALIQGNEFADKVAKNATKSPLIKTGNLNINEINNFLRNHYISEHKNSWNLTSNWYQHINKDKTNIIQILKNNQNANISRRDQVALTRLRLGHTKLTHNHRINKNLPNQCIFCNNTDINLEHILIRCSFFQNQRNNLFPQNNIIETLNKYFKIFKIL